MDKHSTRIGVCGPGHWERACAAGGVQSVKLRATADPRATITERMDAGAANRPTVEANNCDWLMDIDGRGLQFVEGPGGLSDLKLVHEMSGVVLASHFLASPMNLVDTFGGPTQPVRGIPWQALWACLQSKTWVKALASESAVQELTEFGVAGVMHLPCAAENRPRDLSPLAEAPLGPAIAFVGHRAATLLSANLTVRNKALWAANLVNAVQADLPEASFREIYLDLYGLGSSPCATDSAEQIGVKAYEYFSARVQYEAMCGVHQRDRFVMFLHGKLGGQFRIIGQGWDGVGVPADATQVDATLGDATYRQSAINIALGDGWCHDAPVASHFEITAAGGFLLCYRQPSIEQYWRLGSEIDTFGDEQELLEKIRFYLEHPQQRIEMAMAGQRRTLSEHLYSHRLAKLMPTMSPPERPLRSVNGNAVVPKSSNGHAVVQRLAATNAAIGACRVLSAPATAKADPTLLILQNPGRFTRHYLAEMQSAAKRLGIATLVYELHQAWQISKTDKPAATAKMEQWLRANRVQAVIGSGINGTTEWLCSPMPDGSMQSMFDRLGIVHLLWWTDHPQWANQKAGLRDDLQPLLRGGHKHHFVKSEVHARELRDVAGWKHCHHLPVAEDPNVILPATGVEADFDVVAIVGCPPRPMPELAHLLDGDNPDVGAIHAIIHELAGRRLAEMWASHVPAEMLEAMTKLGEAWLARRRDDHLTPSYEHFLALGPQHADAAKWLTEQPRVYFDAAEIVWQFLDWQRTFVLMHLAKRFRVGVFGSDWREVGCHAGGWVDHESQAEVYARGKIAINISQANEEEGASHKPFQIAAAGVPQLHIHRRGIDELFEAGREIEYFVTPGQARAKVAELLADDARRADIAQRARQRLMRDHTWDARLPQMFACAGIQWPSVQTSQARAAASVGPMDVGASALVAS